MEDLEQSRMKPETANKLAGVGAVASGVGAAGAAYKINKMLPATKDAILDAKTISKEYLVKANPKTKWGLFLKFVERKAPKLFAKFGVRLAQAGALAAIPVVGWLGALIQLGFSLWTAWEVYELWKEYNNLSEEQANLDDRSPIKYTEEDKETFIQNRVEELKNEGHDIVSATYLARGEAEKKYKTEKQKFIENKTEEYRNEGFDKVTATHLARTEAYKKFGEDSKVSSTKTEKQQNVVIDKKELRQKINEKLQQYPEQSRGDPNVIRKARIEAEAELKAQKTKPTSPKQASGAGTSTEISGFVANKQELEKRVQEKLSKLPKNLRDNVDTKNEAYEEAEMEMKAEFAKGNAPHLNSANPASSYVTKVAQSESGGQYNTVFGKSGNAMVNGKPITENTVGEVIAWQNEMRKTNRHAAGKYQFINVENEAKLAGIPLSAKFDAATQDKMMEAHTSRNAESLKKQGIEPTNANLHLAHAVGAGGAAKLINAQKQGKGNLIAADVLGLSGEARKTNPQLEKSVDTYVASIEKAQGSESTTTTASKSTTPTQTASAGGEAKEQPKTSEATSAWNTMTSFIGSVGETILGKDAPALKILEKFKQDIGGEGGGKLKEIFQKSASIETGMSKLAGSENPVGDFIEQVSQENIQSKLESSRQTVDVKMPSVPTDSSPKQKPPASVPTAQAPVTDPDMLQHVLYISKGIPYITAGMYN